MDVHSVIPEVIFYIGPEGSGKIRQMLRTMDVGPRSLIVTMDQDPYEFRHCHQRDFPCVCEEPASRLYDPRHIRIVGKRSWQAAIFRSQIYDRIFFYKLPELFHSEENSLSLSLALARLALIRSAQVVVRFNLPEASSIDAWQKPLDFSWRGDDHSIGFWINVMAGPVRYLRMSAFELLRRHRRTSRNKAISRYDS